MTTSTRTAVTGRHRKARMSTRDRVTVALMVLIPTAIVATLVWLPAMATIVFSFFDWDGFGPFSEAKFVGTRWYTEAATIYPAFWPAIQHNVIWLLVLFFIATPIGLLFAVLLDREASHTKFYQTSLYLPVVLSMALIGFIWQLMFSRELEKLERDIGGIQDMTGLPDAIFVIDVGYHKIAVSEAKKLGIPLIGVVDSNHNPEGIDYVIPGNDDSAKAVALYARGIADAILEGRANAVEEVVKAVAAEGSDEFVEVQESAA